MENKPTNTPVLSAEEKARELYPEKPGKHWVRVLSNAKRDAFLKGFEYDQPLREENQQLKERIKELEKEIHGLKYDKKRLSEFKKHRSDCATQIYGGPFDKCDCGFDNL